MLCPPGGATEVLLSCERRDEDEIDDFHAMLEGLGFALEAAWTNFEDAELPTLLEKSHVQGQRKPLRVFRATRTPAGGGGGGAPAAEDPRTVL